MAEVKLLSREDFEAAFRVLSESKFGLRRTPCIRAASQPQADGRNACLLNDVGSALTTGSLHLKLENTQALGSFKLRGLITQMHAVDQQLRSEGRRPNIVTMSAGNYGRTFSFLARQMGLEATVVLPETAPADRAEIIAGLGARVRKAPCPQLHHTVKEIERTEGAVFLHPFDHPALLSGYGSLAVEILDDVPDVDLVAVGCGGGALFAALSAYFHLYADELDVGGICLDDAGDGDTPPRRRRRTKKTPVRVFGVEPETANVMSLSLKSGRAEKLPTSHSVATGLSPPFAGDLTVAHAVRFGSGVVLVSDDEIRAAVRTLFSHGLVVEPSGAAPLAALMSGKLELKAGSLKDLSVVLVLTGGNVSPQDLVHMCQAYM